jgi:CheY-like chemotaxis protein
VKILIVDDDAAMRRVLAAILESGEHTSIWATNGDDALMQMQREQPDLVLLDLNLGRGSVDGVSVLRSKIRNPLIAAIKVIIITGEDVGDYRDSGDPFAGAILTMQKPVGADDLLRKISFLCGGEPIVIEDDTDPGVPNG